jgi:hypothetical protein
MNFLTQTLLAELRSCQSGSRRNGKVARLPQSVRNQINHLLDSGLPYKAIIAKLGPAGGHLNEDNLTNWRRGGYQDHLAAQALADRAQIQTEAAADIIRENQNFSPETLERACTQLSLLHCYNILMERGGEIASQSFKNDPAKLISLVHSLCAISAQTRQLQKPAPPHDPNPSEVIRGPQKDQTTPQTMQIAKQTVNPGDFRTARADL